MNGRIVVTAGGTREPIDAVRYLSNRSSGKMGFALARAAHRLGISVVLIATKFPQELPARIEVVAVESSCEMREAVLGTLQPGDVLLMAAAVADYRPMHPVPNKIKKANEIWALELVRNEDILAEVGALPVRPELFVVGFAAETDDLVGNATKKLHEKNLDLIILNDVSAPGIGMGSDDNAVTIIDKAGIVENVLKSPKDEVADRILAAIGARWKPG